MKKTIAPYLYLGLAAGFVIWGIQEIYLLGLVHALAGQTWTLILGGALLGATFGMVTLAKEGFIQQNRTLLNLGVQWGLGLGFVGGALGFYLTHLLQSLPLELGVAGSYLIWVERMLFITLAVGIGQGMRDKCTHQWTRGILQALISGLVAGLFIAFVSLSELEAFYQRGIAYLFMGMISAVIGFFLINYRRSHWMLSLNGSLAGREFELSKETHYLGTQAEDQINLGSYEEVNSTHAKLIRYETGYSLVDNDPFCSTFVNFRNITEQPLKNGDIIKVGSAIFQYCTID